MLRRKKYFSILLVTLLTFTTVAFSACSQSPAIKTNATKQANTNDANAGPLTPYKDTITISVMRENNPDIWFPKEESIKDNFLTKFYKEKLNISFNSKWLVDRGRMAEQLDLAIASNDLPDAFEANSAQIYKLARAGQIQPIKDVYDKYASTKVKEILGAQNNLFFQPATVDGKVYGIPQTSDFADGIQELYIRQDWLDRLGLQPPKTMDDLTKVSKAFVENDPDGNGIKDTFGISMDNSLSNPVDGIGDGLGVYPDMWLPDSSGKLVYTGVTSGMKNVLQFMQDLYKMGVFDPEFAVKDFNKVTETIAANKVGIIYGAFWAPLVQPQASKKNDPKAVWKCYPIPMNTSGGKIKAWSSNYRWLVIKADFKNPEAVVKQNNLWYELWQGQYSTFYHGKNQTDYKQAQENLKYYVPFWFDPPMKNYEQDIELREALKTNDPSKITRAEAKKMWTLISNPTDLYGWSQNLIVTQSEKVLVDDYKNNYIYSAFQGPTTPLIASKQPLTDKLKNEQYTKFIMGQSLNGWDDFVSNWYKVGGQDLTDEVNKWYQTQTK